MRNKIFIAGFLTISILYGIIFSGCEKKNDEIESGINNFIIIYSDELDFSDIEAYGGKYATPNINRLAEEGILFTNAYTTSPVCNPSRYSLLTGEYPGRSKSEQFLKSNPLNEAYVVTQNAGLSREKITLPELLMNNGYATGISGKWHLGGIEESDFGKNINSDGSVLNKNILTKLLVNYEELKAVIKELGGFSVADNIYPGNTDALPLKELRFHNFGWVTKGAVNFIEDQFKNNNHFFLYVTPTAIHGPNHLESLNFDHSRTLNGVDSTLAEFIPEHDSLKAMCEKIPPQHGHRLVGISNLDYQLKIIVQKLKDLGIYDQTAIIFMADHGIEPGKATCYDRGMKVPLIVRFPNSILNGTKSNILVQNIDWFPTILDYAGIKIPAEKQIDGISLYNYLNEGIKPDREFIYTETGLARSVTDGKYKYISFRYPKSTLKRMKNGEIDFAPNQWNMYKQQHSSIAILYHSDYFDTDQLYDLLNDPYEMNNLAYDAEYSELLEKYKTAAKNFTDSFDHPYEYYNDEFLSSDEFMKMKQKTRALGVDWIQWWKRDHDFQYPPE